MSKKKTALAAVISIAAAAATILCSVFILVKIKKTTD